MRRLTLLLSIAITGTGLSQEGAASGAPLSGPTVRPDSAAPSLIERDYEGRLRALDRPPAIAALDLLGLTDDELAEAREIVAERAALVERLVFNNLLLLGEIGTALEAAPPHANLAAIDPELSRRWADAFEALWDGPPLSYRIRRTLPEHARAPYGSMVSDWKIAALEQARADGLPDGAWPFDIVERDILGREITAAYERGQAGRDTAYEEFLDALDLDPVVEGEVRRVALDAYLRILNNTGKEPTQAEEAHIFREMLTVIPESDHPRVWRAVFRMGMDGDKYLSTRDWHGYWVLSRCLYRL
ncbi:MAG: hypothetical protein AAF235_11685 [Planctomycetota bacterium]